PCMPAKPALVAPNPVLPTPRSGAGPSRLDSAAESTGFGLCLETALAPGSAAPVAPVAARPPQGRQPDGKSPESLQPGGKFEDAETARRRDEMIRRMAN